MGNHSDYFTVFDDFLKVAFNRLFAKIIRPFLGSLCEGLLLAFVPINLIQYFKAGKNFKAGNILTFKKIQFCRIIHSLKKFKF